MMNEMGIEARLAEYQEVDGFQCPAEFWPALGYQEEGRHVAIWWERAGDEASWSDGRDMVVGAEWPSYHVLLAHNFAPDVAGDGLGVVVDYESVIEMFAANLEQDVDEVVERHTALVQALSAYAPRWGHKEEVPS